MNNKQQKEIEEMAKVICNTCETRVSEQQCNSDKRAIYGYCSMCEIITKELLKHYQPKLPEDKVVLSREEYEKLRTELRIKSNEADWRADQLQALDKDFELLEKVVKCKDCKWLEEKHYEEDNEKPYVKLVCKLTKRQCRLYDFCSYGESKV